MKVRTRTRHTNGHAYLFIYIEEIINDYYDYVLLQVRNSLAHFFVKCSDTRVFLIFLLSIDSLFESFLLPIDCLTDSSSLPSWFMSCHVMSSQQGGTLKSRDLGDILEDRR